MEDRKKSVIGRRKSVVFNLFEINAFSDINGGSVSLV